MTRMDPRIAARRRQVQEGRARRSLGRVIRVLGVGATGAAAWWMITSPLFSVSSVSVDGASQAPITELVTEAGAGVGTPLVHVDTARVEEVIESDRWVIEANVARDWPDGLAVSVTERVPVVHVQTTEEVLTVAVDGTILGSSATIDGGPYPVIDARALDIGTPSEDPAMVGAIRFLAALRPQLDLGATGYFGPEGLVARVAGFDVRVGGPDRPEDKAAALRVVLGTRPEEGSIITVVSPDRPAVLPPGAGDDEHDPDDQDDPEEELQPG